MRWIQTIQHQLQKAQSILLLTHKRPDGDGIGAILALYHALKKDKHIHIYLHEELPASLYFLPEHHAMSTDHNILENSYDLVVILDCDSLTRTGATTLEQRQYSQSLIIDHHKPYETNEQEYHHKAVIETASTTIIIYQYLQQCSIPITKEIATCLLTGIVTDTGGFLHESTTPEVLEITADLMKKGAVLSKISRHTLKTKSTNILKLWGRALSRIQQNAETGMTYSVITKRDLKECNATIEDLSGIANILNTIPESKYSLLLTELDQNRIKGSLRTESNNNIDVAKIAQSFGGGGHKLASGFEIEGRLIKEHGKWKIV